MALGIAVYVTRVYILDQDPARRPRQDEPNMQNTFRHGLRPSPARPAPIRRRAAGRHGATAAAAPARRRRRPRWWCRPLRSNNAPRITHAGKQRVPPSAARSAISWRSRSGAAFYGRCSPATSCTSCRPAPSAPPRTPRRSTLSSALMGVENASPSATKNRPHRLPGGRRTFNRKKDADRLEEQLGGGGLRIDTGARAAQAFFFFFFLWGFVFFFFGSCPRGHVPGGTLRRASSVMSTRQGKNASNETS